MNEINEQMQYSWMKEDWYKEQIQRWAVLQERWNFFKPISKLSFIGLGMKNGKTEAHFYVFNIGTPEQIHSVLLSFCESFNSQY